jgi:hypothetical protein
MRWCWICQLRQHCRQNHRRAATAALIIIDEIGFAPLDDTGTRG